MYKAVMFDFFDVVHSDHQKAWLNERGLKREGAYAEASDLLDTGEIDFDDYLSRYANLSGQTPKQVNQQMGELGKLDQGVVDIIDSLRSNYLTGLISNAASAELRPILGRYELPRLFDEIIISSEVGMAKPDPRIFSMMLDKLGVLPEEAIFVDDNPHNVAAATKLGITGICHTDAESLRMQLSNLQQPVLQYA